MSRYLLAFSYDGGSFHGYQIQPNAKTVQSLLQDKLSLLLGSKLEIVGSSRTDTGVHAHQQFAHFDLPEVKKVKENYLTKAVTPTDAEASVIKDLEGTMGDFRILKIDESKIVRVIIPEGVDVNAQ